MSAGDFFRNLAATMRPVDPALQTVVVLLMLLGALFVDGVIFLWWRYLATPAF